MVPTLAEAVPLLHATDELILGLPIDAILAQRFRLPTVDPAEFPEMVRLQIEKGLPFSADEVTTDFEVIEQNETESVVSAIAVQNERLTEIAGVLLDRGFIPKQITVYASQRATTYAPEGRALLIYPEGESLVSAVTENGRVSLTRTLEGVTPEQLQMDLPQLSLSAELQGIPSSFPKV
ncbi:MAG: Type pilus assembly protein PilM, partial [Verrucomicrobiota bacterium]